VFNRVIIFCGCLLIFGGCALNDEPMPEITRIHTPDTEVVTPSRPTPGPTPGTVDENIPKDWLPPPQVEKKWIAIVIHHSATNNGNSSIFDKWHREGRHWEGVGYDFVIGNGTDSGDGQVEVTFRWREQITGAHCKTPNNWANKDAVGICLVGNFNDTAPTRRQMLSLVKLVRFLQNRYGIRESRIYGHNTTPGARKTACPGINFSIAKLKSML